jgi:hypothetical protein
VECMWVYSERERERTRGKGGEETRGGVSAAATAAAARARACWNVCPVGAVLSVCVRLCGERGKDKRVWARRSKRAPHAAGRYRRRGGIMYWYITTRTRACPQGGPARSSPLHCTRLPRSRGAPPKRSLMNCHVNCAKRVMKRVALSAGRQHGPWPTVHAVEFAKKSPHRPWVARGEL